MRCNAGSHETLKVIMNAENPGDSHAGKLELIVGPMRSNKTLNSAEIETRRQYAKQYVLLLKPSEDTKAAVGLVESRTRTAAERWKPLNSGPRSMGSSAGPGGHGTQIGKRIECVAIDEASCPGSLPFTRPD